LLEETSVALFRRRGTDHGFRLWQDGSIIHANDLLPIPKGARSIFVRCKRFGRS
jgi:hypothetical protein